MKQAGSIYKRIPSARSSLTVVPNPPDMLMPHRETQCKRNKKKERCILQASVSVFQQQCSLYPHTITCICMHALASTGWAHGLIVNKLMWLIPYLGTVSSLSLLSSLLSFQVFKILCSGLLAGGKSRFIVPDLPSSVVSWLNHVVGMIFTWCWWSFTPSSSYSPIWCLSLSYTGVSQICSLEVDCSNAANSPSPLHMLSLPHSPFI